MDCLDAQRLVSEKLDHAPLDAASLESAKAHCRSCPDCGRFVRALIAVSNSPLPEPPDGLEGRIISAIHRESAVVDPHADAEPTAAIIGSAATAKLPSSSTGRLRAAMNDPRNERAILAWTTAAAVVFVVAGIGAIVGVRQIFAPPNVMESDSTMSQQQAPATTPPEAGRSSGAESSLADTATATSAPPYITVSGMVYRAAGPAVGIDPNNLKPVGATTSALDSESPPTSREVLTLADPARVYVADNTGGYLGFDRVIRSYGGRIYALSSGEIDSYGEWPTLPSGVTRPQSADGSPNYQPLGPDALGVTVYGIGGSAAQGILVAPVTAPSDPAAQNPDWTWWIPVQ